MQVAQMFLYKGLIGIYQKNQAFYHVISKFCKNFGQNVKFPNFLDLKPIFGLDLKPGLQIWFPNPD